MQSVGKTISFWGKNKVRNNFHIKEKLDFVFAEKNWEILIESCLCLCHIPSPLNFLSLIVTIKTSCQTEDANFFSNFHSRSIEARCWFRFHTDRQTAAPCNESVAVSRPVQLLSLRLKHATCRTDTTPGKKRKNSTNNWASSTSNTSFDNNAWGFCKKSSSSYGDFAR